MDLVVERNGEKVVLDDLPLQPQDYTVDGQTVKMYGFILTWRRSPSRAL